MSQLSCGHVIFFKPLVDRSVKLIEPLAQRSAWRRFRRDDLGKTGAQQTIVTSGTKQDRAPAFIGDSVPM